MNMAFGQRMGIKPNPWGVAPGYGEQRPLANNHKYSRGIMTTNN
jgi:hypothetical protein